MVDLKISLYDVFMSVLFFYVILGHFMIVWIDDFCGKIFSLDVVT